MAKRFAILAATAYSLLLAGTAWAQVPGYALSAPNPGASPVRNAIGVGIYYGVGTVSFTSPPSGTPLPEKAYAELMAAGGSVSGPGFALGFSYGTWGLIFGRDDNHFTINQTLPIDSNPAHNVFIHSVRRINTSLSLLWTPHKWFYFGLGHDTGTVAFDETVQATGVDETRTFDVEQDFFTLALALGFDPTKPGFGPIFTVYTRVPLQPTPFGFTLNVVGVGLYF